MINDHTPYYIHIAVSTNCLAFAFSPYLKFSISRAVVNELNLLKTIQYNRNGKDESSKMNAVITFFFIPPQSTIQSFSQR